MYPYMRLKKEKGNKSSSLTIRCSCLVVAVATGEEVSAGNGCASCVPPNYDYYSFTWSFQVLMFKNVGCRNDMLIGIEGSEFIT